VIHYIAYDYNLFPTDMYCRLLTHLQYTCTHMTTMQINDYLQYRNVSHFARIVYQAGSIVVGFKCISMIAFSQCLTKTQHNLMEREVELQVLY